jgi:hypothetical protein
MTFKKSILFFLLLFLFCFKGKGQTLGIGASGIYNFQAEGFGVGVRASIFPNNRLSFVPQFSYFLPFNKVHEYYICLAGEYKFIERDRINAYAILQGGYNSWLNYADSPMEGAKQNNWDLEGGFGISNYNCLRPFIEYRYNLRHRETNLHLGLLFVFGCRTKSSKGHCDAYGYIKNDNLKGI